MEATDDDWNFRLPKRSRDIKGARILVRLNTDEPNKAEITVTPDASKERRHVDTGVRLVDRHNIDFDVAPRTCRFAQSAAIPYMAASEFEGIIARHQRITYPSSS